jgi:hypothetical protein
MAPFHCPPRCPTYRASSLHKQRNRSCSSGIHISEQGLFAHRLIVGAKIK